MLILRNKTKQKWKESARREIINQMMMSFRYKDKKSCTKSGVGISKIHSLRLKSKSRRKSECKNEIL